ncbi:GGDEF domain-containing protein [Aeromicrobium sp. UC242_57]|uniref:GGDEF domain-containing protein n=1 Tax=Aeromicrobium sp. UC242_57 TaxID=3374624 RepID=UPI0037BAE185
MRRGTGSQDCSTAPSSWTWLPRSSRRAKPDGTEVALILADLDHFKNINDTFGHMAGDHALQVFSAACTDTVRSTDLVGRYGGEEFIFLLTGTSLDRAEQITSEISRRIHSMQTPEGGLPTVSLRHRVHR